MSSGTATSRRPKVSVCIASYNHARFLPAALDSALAQTYRDFEIILVDDGSTDDSLKIAESYAAAHPSIIRVFTHPGHRNLGISTTSNLVYQHSSGEYWAGLPSDDVWYPEKLELQVAYLDGHPEAGFVYGYAHLIDEEGQRLPGMFGGDIAADPMTIMLQVNRVPAPTVMVRRECFERLGLYDESLVYQDWEMWIRLLAHYKAGFIGQPLTFYRIHGYNTSFGINQDVHIRHQLATFLAIQQKALSIGGAFADARVRALIELQVSYLTFCVDDRDKAAEWLRSAFSTDPSLCTDFRYCARWLEARHEDEVQRLRNSAMASNFVPWILAQLPPITGRPFAMRLERRMAGVRYAMAAYECRGSDLRKARRMVVSCFWNYPSRLSDRTLLALLVETFVGTRVMARVRRAKRRLSSHQQEPTE